MNDVKTTQEEFQTYEEFFAFYLREHSNPINRLWHYVGTVSAVSFFVWCMASGYWQYSLLAVVIGYGCAWTGHFVFEGNKPATFGHPGWSFISDFRMLFLFVTGRLGPALDAAQNPVEKAA